MRISIFFLSEFSNNDKNHQMIRSMKLSDVGRPIRNQDDFWLILHSRRRHQSKKWSLNEKNLHLPFHSLHQKSHVRRIHVSPATPSGPTHPSGERLPSANHQLFDCTTIETDARLLLDYTTIAHRSTAPPIGFCLPSDHRPSLDAQSTDDEHV
ncbi:hypothetical protein E3N88_12367 [Mikania micrantha]|uniref:Uncharacterized protein n=1 Tax=Mikania micrantha TaxID=192012 RepID=A0A5N6P6L9_9ASTR|nr:hypothetical protein E3N88_12367 [Mikania micrantha]